MERALREESANKDQRYQDVEKTEAERKFEEIKRQRVSYIRVSTYLYILTIIIIANGKSIEGSNEIT